MHVKLIYERRDADMKDLRMVFKITAYVYLSWQLCAGMDRVVGHMMDPHAQKLTDRLNGAVAKKRKEQEKS